MHHHFAMETLVSAIQLVRYLRAVICGQAHHGLLHRFLVSSGFGNQAIDYLPRDHLLNVMETHGQ